MQSDKPGLIYVYNAIDTPSREFLSTIEKIEKQHDGKLAVNRIDTYKSNGLALMLKLEQVPAVVITKEGKVVEKFYTLDENLINGSL